jgi:ribosome-associated translation inhibitor RaiA
MDERGERGASAMVVHLHAGHALHSAALEEHARQRMAHELGALAGRVTRVDVYVSDENAGKHGGADKRCAAEAHAAGMDPITVESRAGDVYVVVTEAARKMQRALQARFQRSDGR